MVRPLPVEKFHQFASVEGFVHHRVTPHWPHSNGMIERFMRSLKKFLRSNTSLRKFLRSYRSTPHTSTQSPKDLLMRTLSSITRMPVFRREFDHDPEVVVEDARAKKNIKQYSDRYHVQRLAEVELGDLVLVKTEL